MRHINQFELIVAIQQLTQYIENDINNKNGVIWPENDIYRIRFEQNQGRWKHFGVKDFRRILTFAVRGKVSFVCD